MLPFVGQFGSGKQSLILQAASDGMFVNCFILSTETILFSTKQLVQIARKMAEFKDRPYERESHKFCIDQANKLNEKRQRNN